MSYGKMRDPVTIIRVHHEKDADGFAETRDEVLARVRAYHEQRHGSTAGFFGDNVQAGRQVWDTCNMLLRLERDWSAV